MCVHSWESHLDIPVASLLPYLQFLPPPVQLLLQSPPDEILKTWTLPFSESCVASSHLYYKVQTPSPQGTLNLVSLSVLPACGPSQLQLTHHSSQAHTRLSLITVPGACSSLPPPALRGVPSSGNPPDSSKPNIGFVHCISMFIPLVWLLSHFCGVCVCVHVCFTLSTDPPTDSACLIGFIASRVWFGPHT